MGRRKNKKPWILCLLHQGVAVLGIALIAMGEEIGSEMALRTFGHLVSYTTLLAVNLFSFIAECFVALSHHLCEKNSCFLKNEVSTDFCSAFDSHSHHSSFLFLKSSFLSFVYKGATA